MKEGNKCSNFLDYKVIGQEVRNRRLAKGYTQKDLAGKIGVTYQVVLQYEKGTRKISIEKLYSIAEVLSINITDLIPVSKEKICLKNEKEEILNLIRKYRKINDQELRRMFCLLTKIARVGEENSKKTERIKIAKGLVKEGISIDIVSKTIGLSANECVEEKGGSIYCQIGKIKGWSTGGSKEYYRYHALSADRRVKDALVESPIPGKVQISILSTQLSTTGILSEELLEIVKKQVARDDIRVLTDTVTVIGCNITEIDIHSRMSISSVISKEEIKKQFIKKFELAKRLGWSVTKSWIIANLFVEGVENVELIEPKEDVVVLGNECARLGNLELELVGR